MKKLSVIGLALIAVLVIAADRRPILRAFLQSNLDGNGFAITNVIVDLANSTNLPVQPLATVANYVNGVLTNRFANTGSNAGGSLTLTGPATATNFNILIPQWVDMIGHVTAGSGSAAPLSTAITNGSIIKLPGFQLGDEEFYSIQMPHNIAITNSSFTVGTSATNWHIEPHLHFTTSGTIDATHSNVLWRLEWVISNINGNFIAQGTNSVTTGVTQNGKHYLVEFGAITNNAPYTISAVFACRLSRQSAGAQELAPNPTTRDAIRLAFDVHVPVGNYTIVGSRDETNQ